MEQQNLIVDGKVQPQNGTALQVSAPTPMDLLQIAMTQGADIDKLAKLMELQERWDANAARKAFTQALANFKAHPPKLTKNKEVDFTGKTGIRTHYWHATLDNIADTIGQELSKHGLSFRWSVEQKENRIHVSCVLQHCLGHTESVTMNGPPDETGNKNAVQQVGSTVTYLQRYTLLAATGMATADQDDDAQLAGMAEEWLSEKVEWFQSARDSTELQKLFAEAYREVKKINDHKSMSALIDAKDARKKELAA